MVLEQMQATASSSVWGQLVMTAAEKMAQVRTEPRLKIETLETRGQVLALPAGIQASLGSAELPGLLTHTQEW